MSNIETRGIGDLCSEYYIEYGRELNSNRALPQLMDGLKPSYRRAIYTALQAPGNHMKSLDFVGNMFKIHPHGDKSIVGVETKLVRAGIFKELANFGYYPIYGQESGAAAPRYTETGVEDNWYDIFKPFLPSLPYVPGEVEGVSEPEYLGTVLPLALVIGLRGVGIGANTNIPSFSPKSLLDAYLNDDPSLLKPYYDVEIDYENSELERLWNTGTGRVIYKYHVYPETDASGCQGVVVEGDTQIFTPYWWQIDEWKDQGLLFVRDESTGGKNRIFIGKNKNVRKINQDDILQECNWCCSTLAVFAQTQYTYKLGVFDGTQARYISMREWIDTTYKNYMSLVEKFKTDNINKLSFNKEVALNIRKIGEVLMNAKGKMTVEEISEVTNTDLEVVKAISRKSIMSLNRFDVESEVARINEEIKYYQSIIPEDYARDIINRMSH